MTGEQVKRLKLRVPFRCSCGVTYLTRPLVLGPCYDEWQRAAYGWNR